MELNEALQRERERQKLTKYRLAKMAGITQSHLLIVERGDHYPSMDTLLKILTALKASVTINPDGTTTVKSKK